MIRSSVRGRLNRFLNVFYPREFSSIPLLRFVGFCRARAILRAFAGAGELVVGLNELAFLIAFVPGDVGVDLPLARQIM